MATLSWIEILFLSSIPAYFLGRLIGKWKPREGKILRIASGVVFWSFIITFAVICLVWGVIVEVFY